MAWETADVLAVTTERRRQFAILSRQRERELAERVGEVQRALPLLMQRYTQPAAAAGDTPPLPFRNAIGPGQGAAEATITRETSLADAAKTLSVAVDGALDRVRLLQAASLPDALYVQGDITDPEFCRRVVSEASSRIATPTRKLNAASRKTVEGGAMSGATLQQQLMPPRPSPWGARGA